MKNITLFYFILLVMYLLFFGHLLIDALGYPDILIWPIMALGSFVAGSTFLGGGAVAFPALTKILFVDPVAAKTFALAIQSVGMTSASIYIFSKTRAFPFKMMFGYLLGALIGLISCLFYFQYMFLSTDIRIGFTLFVCCSLGIYLWTISASQAVQQKSKKETQTPLLQLDSRQIFIVFCCGVIGGFISGLIGSGADLMVFAVLTLYFRSELKFSIQVSVVSMAFISIVGFITQLVFFSSEINKISNLWYLAAPIVILGAPLGVIFCRRISPNKLLIFISALVSIEVFSTLFLLEIDMEKIPFYLIVVIVSIALLFHLYKESPYKDPIKYQNNNSE